MIPMCDYCSNYRACQPQLVHCFSSVSLLINESLVITGFMRKGVKTLAGPHSTLLTASMKPFGTCLFTLASRTAWCLLQRLFFPWTRNYFLLIKGKWWRIEWRKTERKSWWHEQGEVCGQPRDNYTCKAYYIKKRAPAGRRNETCAGMEQV